jgi:hypothetical protein
MLISEPDQWWIDNGIQVKSTLSQTLSDMGTRKYNEVRLNDSILSKFPHDSLWQNVVALVFSRCPCCLSAIQSSVIRVHVSSRPNGKLLHGGQWHRVHSC